MAGRRSLIAGVALLAACVSARAETPDPLAPYQLVRSLQLVQDQIADGDHAALPMQQRLIKMIDERLSESQPEDFADGRNFRALMLYAMSGGNPRTVERLMTRLVLDERDAKLSAGLLQYLRGNPGGAIAALNGIEPTDVAAELSPFLALVKGTIVAGKEPEKAIAMLDKARMLGPGTLIEEAALRRTMVLATQMKRADRFLSASEQYVRRFLRSPYASQFADGFVAGVVALHETVDLHQVVDIVAGMTPEQSRVVYLRIARRAAIDRTDDLLAFATKELEAGAENVAPDPRADLYRALAEVASADPAAVQTRLSAIDRKALSASDRVLLDAAAAVVGEVVRPVAPHEPEPPAEAAAAAEPPAEPAPGPSDHGAPVDYAEQPLNEEPAPPEPSVQRVAQKPADAAPADAPLSEEAAYVARTRERLAAIDEMLKETSQ
ncbi:MAG: chemotaxis protein MotC [Rhizobiaceae bacterium]|nr:chemotaxis protein MotC [Rhizobiaceae bacterium]